MKTGHYIIIRFNPDPARNELRNVGVLLWDDEDFRLRIDDESVRKIIRENPHLHDSALDWIDESVRSCLGASSIVLDPERAIAELLETARFPLSFTEPLFTTIDSNKTVSLDSTIRSLIERIVKPRNRPVAKAVNPIKILKNRLQPLILNKVVQPNYPFETSGTGLTRTVDFYANSTANVVLEAIQFNLRTNPTGIRSRADAEANKLRDIQEANPNVKFLVYCSFSEMEGLREANTDAINILKSSNADVETGLNQAAQRFETLVRR